MRSTLGIFPLLLLLLKAAGSHSNPFNISGTIEPNLDSGGLLHGVGVNIVNIFWERLSTALGDEWDDSKPAGPRPNPERHSLAKLKGIGIDLVRFAASPYCPNQFALW
jgi:hypothetical protein